MTKKASNDFFICIDPGVNFCSIVVVKPGNPFKVIDSTLVNNSRVFDAHYKEVEKKYGTRITKIIKITDNLNILIDKYGITQLAVEAPFYSARTPVAFASLLEVVFSIRYLVVFPRDILMTLIEPTAVKKIFTVKGNAKKDIMKEFLFKKLLEKEITIKTDPDLLSEHEIDGIAVGYSYFQNKLKEV